MKHDNWFESFNGREINGQHKTISSLPLLDEKGGLHDLVEFLSCTYVNISSFCLRPRPAVQLDSRSACKTMLVNRCT
jgi:hypothetical protein